MSFLAGFCRLLSLILLSIPLLVFAETPVNSMVVFGDSLSDTGNTTHLLKSLRKDEDPSYLVSPLKVFVVNKMTQFANDYYIPQTVLDAGIKIVQGFFDQELGPLLATLVSRVRTVPVLPGEPYWQARFSNGPVWNEYLATMLKVDRNDLHYYDNQAFGGSWSATYDYQLSVWNLIRYPLASLKNLVAGKLIPPSLGLTVQAYLLNNEKLNEQAVYFLLSGANDYLNVLNFEDNYNQAMMSSYIDNVLASLANNVQRLTKAGARQIVVIGLPDIGDTPRFNKTSDKAVLSAAITLHNQRLEKRVEEWKKALPQVDFLYVNIQPFLQDAIQSPEKYGLTNVTEACIDVKLPRFSSLVYSPFWQNYVLQYAQVLQYRDKNFAEGENNFHVCELPENYLFWDEVHPTTKAHQYLANAVCEAMKGHGYEASCQLSVNT